ncbi:MAG: NRDE family protein [Halioglobus sp.]|nr:NRDE family protein [Halioglobus sp.]MDG2325778.1 NRDE family protein [Halioglobus sp.]
MCLILFAHQVNNHYPLVVAANRDEFHQRPTDASHYWLEHPQVLAGRDRQAGGSWMGVNRSGHFAAVTNSRDPEQTKAAERSRGELVLGYLQGDLSAQQYLDQLSLRAGAYAGFNLLLGDREDLWYVSNSGPSSEQSPRRLTPGIYGLSNASLDTPWPKVQRGKQVMAELLQYPLDHSALATAVDSRQLASKNQLDLQAMNTEMDQLLSAQFIVGDTYGTRATTTCWQTSAGEFHWKERSFDARGDLIEVVEKEV